MKRIVIIASVLVAGCSQSVPPTSQIMPPSARLMEPPAALEEVKPGSDLVVEHLKLRKQYLNETARLKSLQGYVRTIRGAKP